MVTDEERKLLTGRTCECTAQSGCCEAQRVQLIERLLGELADLQKPLPEVPLFEGEPDHCALCGAPGHTHDDHWIFAEVEHLGLCTCTRTERGILDIVDGIPYEAVGKHAASPGEPWEPLRRAIRALKEASDNAGVSQSSEDDLEALAR